MKAGVLALGRESLSELGHLAQLAETVGFDDFWVADERFFGDAYVCLAHCANLTHEIRLGPCVTDPYSRHPALTAMAIATLDEMSDGRALLGIGAGVSGFAEIGIARRRPATAIQEAVQIIHSLLAGERVEYHGEVISLSGAALGFTPARRLVPTYVASNRPLGQRVAGAVADGAIMEGCGNVAEVKALANEVRIGAESVGGDVGGSVELVARLNTCVAEDGESARDTLRPHVARTLATGRLGFATLKSQGIALPEEATAGLGELGYVPGVEPYLHLLELVPDHFVDALSLAGTTDEVIAQATTLCQAGVNRFVVHPIAAPGQTVADTIRHFGEAVIPAVRETLS